MRPALVTTTRVILSLAAGCESRPSAGYCGARRQAPALLACGTAGMTEFGERALARATGKAGMRKLPTNGPASAKLKALAAASNKTWSLFEEPFLPPQPEGRKPFRLPKVEALAKEVEAQRERLQKEPRTTTQSMERLVRKVEDVAERADCIGGWFAQFDEAQGGTSIESWRHIVRLLPSDLAARMARACLRLAQSA